MYFFTICTIAILHVYICMYNKHNANEKSYAINCWVTEDPL